MKKIKILFEGKYDADESIKHLKEITAHKPDSIVVVNLIDAGELHYCFGHEFYQLYKIEKPNFDGSEYELWSIDEGENNYGDEFDIQVIEIFES